MDTTDGPVIAPLIIPALVTAGVGVGVTALTGGFKKPDSGSRPAQTAASLKTEQPTKTAAPIEALSEQAKRSRRLAANVLTRPFAKEELKLGIPALMGA